MAISNFETGLTPGAGENKGYDAATIQEWLDRKVVDNIEEQLYFVKLGIKPELHAGYGKHAFAKVEKVNASNFTKTTITGVVADTDVKIGSIVVKPEMFSISGTIHRMVEEFQPLDILKQYAFEFSNAAARKMEEMTQEMITDYLTASVPKWKQMVVTGGTGTLANLAAFTSDNTSTTKLTLANIAAARGRLAKRSVKGFGNANGKYIGLIHPECSSALQTERSATSIGWFDAVVGTEQGMMDLKAGAVGTKFGITFYEYPFAQALESTGKGTPDVYPTFIMGEGAFFCLKWSAETTYVTGADSGNTNAIWKKVGVSFIYNCLIRDADRIVVILSQQ